MEAAAISASFHGKCLDHAIFKKIQVSHVPSATGKLFYRASTKRIFSSVKASTLPVVGKSDSGLSLPVDKKTSWSSFPDGCEKFITGICDDTEIAEVMVKVGSFEMHLKRNVGAPTHPTPVISPTTAPPIPSEPMNVSALTSPTSTLENASPATNSYFSNMASGKSSKLAALDSSGTTYVVIPSPSVGYFRNSRKIKGKRLPPCCNEGDMIEEGKVVGFVDQFGGQLPVKSNVEGEVLKVLVKDGEAIGFGDPLVAVLPSFHSINKY